MNSRELLLTPIDEIHHAARDDHGGKERRHDAQAVHHGKAAHRARAEDKQRNTGNQARDVRVDNRRKGHAVTLADGELRRSPNS